MSLPNKTSLDICSLQRATRLTQTLAPRSYYPHSAFLRPGLRLPVAVHQARRQLPPTNSFSTTSAAHLREVFPVKETDYIRRTPPAWPHHGYTQEELLSVVPQHREPKTVGDWIAWKVVRICRWGTDLATGIKDGQQVDKNHPTTAVTAQVPLTEAQWLVRFIFLESIAGVPGMVAGMLRHLGSLRRLRRDNGWIETLLEESYNERMHLLTFLKMCEQPGPGWVMRTAILLAQGVFFNALFASYLVSPALTHRFVGYLEEEAVHTYTRCLAELERGRLPTWSDPAFAVPDVAVAYWDMAPGRRTMRDLLLYIRADEAVHRGVNHTFGNLVQEEDPNPFVSDYKAVVAGAEGVVVTESNGSGSSSSSSEALAPSRPNPVLKGTGYEREDVIGR